MNREECTVAVDVGNTAVKLAVQLVDRVIDHTIAHDHNQWHLEALDWVGDQLGCGHTQWRISSVHRRAAQTLIDAIELKDAQRPSSQTSHATIHLIDYQDVPIQVAVPEPGRVGIDRLLSGFAAAQLGDPDRLKPDHNGGIVVVDAGSAITVDWIDHRDGQLCFCGGAILPGLSLQARALATGTDALPQVRWDQGRSVQLPADNTLDAIHGGILVGAAAAIDALAKRYLNAISPASSASPASLVLTGGDAATLSPHLHTPHHHCAQLVCRGLLELPLSPSRLPDDQGAHHEAS